MPTTQVKFVQGALIGTAGISLFGKSGALVTCSNGNDTGVTAWKWEIVDVPPGSAVPLTVQGPGPTSTITFTPDVPGSYLVRLTTYLLLIPLGVDESSFTIASATGRYLPPFMGSIQTTAQRILNFSSQQRGWATTEEQWFGAIDQGVVSAMSQGCQGDGTTDDRANLLAANAVAAAKGWAVLLPAGVYKIGSNLTFTAPVIFQPGAKLAPVVSATVTMASFQATQDQFIFGGAGSFSLSRRIPSPISVLWFGADPTFAADSTAAIQTALNTVGANGGGRLFFPGGVYKILSQIHYVGSLSSALTLIGSAANGVGAAGEVSLQWASGNFAGAMVQFDGVTGLNCENINFLASSAANVGCLYAVWVQEGSPAVSTEEVHFVNCVFGGAMGTGSSAFAMGTAAGFDVAELVFERCGFEGQSGTTSECGFLVLGTGNTKQAYFNRCIWRQCNRSNVRAAIGLNGTWTFIQPVFSSLCIADFEVPVVGNSLHVINSETEGSDRLIYSGGTAGASGGNIILDGCFWDGASTDDHTAYGGAMPNALQDYVVVVVGAYLHMRGCTFVNARVPNVSESLINVACDSTNQAGILSTGNFFANSTAQPFYDGAGNNLITQDFAKGVQCPIFSRGDFVGLANGGSYASLPPIEGRNVQVQTQAALTQFTAAGITIDTPGAMVTTVAKFTISYTAFQAAALTSTPFVCNLPKKARVLGVICDTTVAYAGTAGTLQLSIGDGVGTPTIDYLLQHDVKTAPVRKGLVTGDLGSFLAPAANNAIGFINSWTASNGIYAELVSSSGNLSGLNAGSTDLYITFQVLP